MNGIRNILSHLVQKRETGLLVLIALVIAIVSFVDPRFLAWGNLRDLLVRSAPTAIIACGVMLVVVTAEIDISVGSVFAICGVAAGIVAKAGLPMPIVAITACLVGAALGSINGVLVARVRIPSIVVTLATMVALRDGLRWATDGAWVQDLPANFQWLGLTQATYPFVAFAIAAVLTLGLSWGLRYVAAGRAVYATGSNPEAARLAGLHTEVVTFVVFAIAGGLTGLAALLNSVRFNQIPSNAGLGLELKVIAACVVGGTAITGGRGSVGGTVLGVVLLGIIGPALTFLGVSAYWERAIQGAIILAAVAFDALRDRPVAHAVTLGEARS